MFYFGWPFMASWGLGWGVFGILISILVIVIIVRVIVRVARGESWHYHRHHRHWDEWTDRDEPGREARRILDERYARGEINDEEYKRMKENLK